MKHEVIERRHGLLVRRMILEPGEASDWHVDRCVRSSVVLRGSELTIEFRDSGERIVVPVQPGMADMDEPDARCHRAINTGSSTYEEVVTFLLQGSDDEPQPVVP